MRAVRSATTWPTESWLVRCGCCVRSRWSSSQDTPIWTADDERRARPRSRFCGVCTLTSDMEIATEHLMVVVGTDSHTVLDQARGLLAERHGITHATLQFEPVDHHGCEDVSW